MSRIGWLWWKAQAKFWIYRSSFSFLWKQKAIQSIDNDDMYWYNKAWNGTNPRDAAETYMRIKPK